MHYATCTGNQQLILNQGEVHGAQILQSNFFQAHSQARPELGRGRTAAGMAAGAAVQIEKRKKLPDSDFAFWEIVCGWVCQKQGRLPVPQNFESRPDSTLYKTDEADLDRPDSLL